MITILTGENSFEIERDLEQIVANFKGKPERIDGETLQLKQLPDLLMGGSLFNDVRLIVIRGLSQNKSIWSILPDWLNRVPNEIHLVLIEPKLDKRTVTYKTLQKIANMREFTPWNARDGAIAEKWATEEATRQNLKLDKKIAHKLVEIVGLDQWRLFHAIEKLALLGDASIETVLDTIERSPSDNAFNLLETAIAGDIATVQATINDLKSTEDPYRLFGLLSSQVFQLVVIANSKAGDDVAKDFAIHPFAVSKSKPLAKKLGSIGAKNLLDIFVSADTALKNSSAEPWAIIENALLKIAKL